MFIIERAWEPQTFSPILSTNVIFHQFIVLYSYVDWYYLYIYIFTWACAVYICTRKQCIFKIEPARQRTSGSLVFELVPHKSANSVISFVPLSRTRHFNPSVCPALWILIALAGAMSEWEGHHQATTRCVYMYV